MKRKSISYLALILGLVLLFTACQSDAAASTKEWKRIKESAENSTVHLYTWTEDQALIEYLKETVAPNLLTECNITLKVENDDKEKLLASLANDKKNKNEIGNIDLILLETEDDYKDFKKDELLYNNYTYDLEDLGFYFSAKDLNLQYFGATKIKQDILPFNQNLLTFYYDQDVLYDPPKDLEAFREFLKNNLASFTYPQPTDEVGGAFVRSVILNFVDADEFVKKDLSVKELRALVKPGIDYLKSIKPYLYAMGETYPQTAEAMSELYASQDIIFMMSLDYRHSNKMTGDAIYTMGTRPFVLGNSSVGTIEYLGVPYNSDNKAGAMLALNYMLGSDVQVSKLKDKHYYGVPPYTASATDDEVKKVIRKAIRKKDIVKMLDLMEVAKHDIPEKYHKMIADYWQEEIMTE